MRCPCEKGKFGHRDRHTQGDHHVSMKAKIRVIHLQAKECQRLAANHQKLGGRHRIDSPSQPSEGTSLADTLI